MKTAECITNKNSLFRGCFLDIVLFKKKSAFYYFSKLLPCFFFSFINHFLISSNNKFYTTVFSTASFVSLLAFGSDSPIPLVVIREALIPFAFKYAAEEAARIGDQYRGVRRSSAGYSLHGC